MPRQGLLDRIAQWAGVVPGAKASNSSGWPSGSRNLNAVTPPEDGGRICGPSVESPSSYEGPANSHRPLSYRDTTIAKC